MHLAASEGHLEVVKLLVDQHGADVSPVDRWEGRHFIYDMMSYYAL